MGEDKGASSRLRSTDVRRCLTRENREGTLAAVAMLRQSKGVHMERKCRFPRFIVACAGVLALCGLFAAAASARPTPQTAPGDLLDPRTYAPDSRLFLVVHAIGVQKYTCQANGTWLFTDPEATLYKKIGRASCRERV